MRTFLLLITLLTANIVHAQSVIYVSANGTGGGTSWNDACSLDSAMRLAQGTPSQVWLKEGLYFLNKTLPVSAFTEIYGGFNGTETTLSQRHYAQNKTILDAQRAFAAVHLGQGAMLNGLAVINGYSHMEPTPYGGGVWMEADARVENCYVLDNRASDYGGGIYAEGNGLVYNTLLTGNNAGVDGLAIWGSTLDVRHITASENYRWGDPVTVDSNYCNILTPAWAILGQASFATDSVWLVDTLLWSDAVTVTTCQKTVFDGGGAGPPPTFHSDCRTNPDYKGDLFSWCAVKKFGDMLCPKPWRAPVPEDYRDKSLGMVVRCVRTCPLVTIDFPYEAAARHQAVCQNEPIATVAHIFSNTATKTTLSWDSVPKGIAGDAASFSGTPTVPGVYTWTVTAWSSDTTCPPKTSTGTITVNALPAAITITTNDLACDSAVLTASNGNDGTIYWQNTTNTGTDTDFATDMQTVKTDGTYYFRAQSDEGCWGEQDSAKIDIVAVPTINTHPNNEEQRIVEGGTFPELLVRMNGFGAFLPQWYSNTVKSNVGGTLISGAKSLSFTPPASVVDSLFYYCVVSNACGDAVSDVSGAHVVEEHSICSKETPGWGNSLGAVSFATDEIWVVGNQVWSDAVTTSSCQKENYDGGGFGTFFKTDCRSNPSYKGDLFSWCAIAGYDDVLCPMPWRVPAANDFMALNRLFGGVENAQYNFTLIDKYFNDWGGAYGGASNIDGSLINQNSAANYWSQSEYDANNGYNLHFNAEGLVYPQGAVHKTYGHSLRCVRDTIISPELPPAPTGCNTDTPGWGNELGTVSFATDKTWTVGNQVWSDAVQTTNCSSKYIFDGGGDYLSPPNYNTDCRSNPGYPGDLFSWCAVARYDDVLCPKPWRVPTPADHVALKAAGGTTGTILFGTLWGSTAGGYCDATGSLLLQRSCGFYWSSSEVSARVGSCLYFFSSSVYPEQPSDKARGLFLRCVRDTVIPPELPPAPTGCNTDTPGWGNELGTVSFATDETWTVGNQVWSDAVQTTNCSNRTTYNGRAEGDFNADCRSNPSYKGDLFSWCAVSRYEDILCPDEWRVPTVNDFIDLDKAFGGSGGYSQMGPAHRDKYLNNLGSVYGGFCDISGRLMEQGLSTGYWSSSEQSSDVAYHLNLWKEFGTVYPQGYDPKDIGLTLRCVRDTIIPPSSPTGCNSDIPGWGNDLGTVSFATDETWTVGNQVWSDAVQATNCSSKTIYNGGDGNNFNADCRSNPSYKGDLFSWCAVNRYVNELCPSPWRVPTVNDFIALDITFGGNGDAQANSTYCDKYLNDWSGEYGGISDPIGSLIMQGWSASYWAQSSADAVSGRLLTFNSIGGSPQSINSKANGQVVRCVRDK
ncbi:MAG: hypothetical protein LBU91_01210 [Bacteroidales bacterium]|jgi:uncharacterized protein (TIGR02145 family)|nr:hypothetical protein [Bacteroidales bacterium]